VQTLSKYYNSTYSTQPKFFSERQMGPGRKTKLVSIANAITLVRQFSATTSDGTRERFVSVLEELLRGNLGLIFDCPNYKAGEGAALPTTTTTTTTTPRPLTRMRLSARRWPAVL
jgi:hypothetical protein